MTSAGTWHLCAPPHPERSRLPLPAIALLTYLAAITIFGKGPTYLFHPPFLWAEMTLVLVSAWLILHGMQQGFPPRLFHPLGWLIFGFMLLGGISTLAHYPMYGEMALRDAMLWYYAAFYFVGLYLTAFSVIAQRLWQWLVTIWPLAMLWYFLCRLTNYEIANASPLVPWRGVPVLGGSSSENIQHMAMATVLLLLGFPSRGSTTFLRGGLELAVAALSASLFLTAYGRGIRIAVIASLFSGVLLSWISGRRLWPTGRLYTVGTILVMAIGVAAILAGPEGLTKIGRLTRFEEIRASALSGTAYWRQMWWSRIVEKVQADDPLFGLGFGYNLGNLNPLLIGDENNPFPVRSPHNINITVFGRMGYVGFILWCAILLFGLGGLAWRIATGKYRYALERHKELLFWFIFLLCTWLNSSFLVLMEGPVLGVWFWFALGFATGRSLGPDGLLPALPPAPESRIACAS